MQKHSSLCSPASEILEYLAKHPDAQDTIDGIVRWWVLDSYLRKGVPRVERTVARLVKQGFLEEKLSPDGKIFYHVSSRYLVILRQTPVRNSSADAPP